MRSGTRRDLYRALRHCALLLAGFGVIALLAASLPNRANAFWPFSTHAGATTNALIPSPSTPALVAPVNRNPSSGVPIALAISGGSALISYNGPSGTIADVESMEQSDRISIYVVRPGDTLSEIAAMFGVSVNTILWANSLNSARDVHPGDTLIILPVSGVEHTVKKGDTLQSLAKRYGADADEIALFNDLDASAHLAVGSTLIIPGGELTAQAAPAKSGSATSGARNLLYGGGGSAIPGYFLNPVPGGIITQGLHGWNGVDLGAPRGTPIYAAADGVVIISRGGGGWNGGYGNYIVITHRNGSQTLYSHLKSTVASFGQSVSQGQLIGYVGATGRVTGSHLHFEVRGAGNPLRNCRIGTICSPQ